jgi:hypothetical protein
VLTAATSSNAILNTDSAGTYAVRLTVNDSKVNSLPFIVKVTATAPGVVRNLAACTKSGEVQLTWTPGPAPRATLSTARAAPGSTSSFRPVIPQPTPPISMPAWSMVPRTATKSHRVGTGSNQHSPQRCAPRRCCIDEGLSCSIEYWRVAKIHRKCGLIVLHAIHIVCIFVL